MKTRKSSYQRHVEIQNSIKRLDAVARLAPPPLREAIEVACAAMFDTLSRLDKQAAYQARRRKRLSESAR